MDVELKGNEEFEKEIERLSKMIENKDPQPSVDERAVNMDEVEFEEEDSIGISGP